MIDNDLENQINVKIDDWTYRQIKNTADNRNKFMGEVVRNCVMRCIRQDSAPKWKRWFARLIKY